MGILVSVSCECGYSIRLEAEETANGFTVEVIPGLETGDLDVTLMLGSGMSGQDPCFWPALCRQCKEVRPVDLASSEVRCPVCGGTDGALYASRCGAGKDEIPGSTILFEDKEYCLYSDLGYECPRCKRKSLQFKHVGYWD